MSHDNRNVSSIGKTLNSLTDKKFCPIKSHLYSSTKMPKKNKVLSKKGKWINNSTTRYQCAINIPLQNEIMKVKKIERKDYMESIDNKSYDDMNDDNPVIMLRKEIQDWRINEILTSRTEERLTGTPSEQHSCSYGILFYYKIFIKYFYIYKIFLVFMINNYYYYICSCFRRNNKKTTKSE